MVEEHGDEFNAYGAEGIRELLRKILISKVQLKDSVPN